MTIAMQPDSLLPLDSFTVDTVLHDSARARLRLGGVLNADRAAIVSAAATAQIFAGRRYLRIELCDVPVITTGAVSALRRLHEVALADRGTVVFTGAAHAVAERLSRDGSDLLWLARSAEDDHAAQHCALDQP